MTLSSETNKFMVRMLSGEVSGTDDLKSIEESIEFKLFQLDRKIRRRAPFKLSIDYVSNKPGLVGRQTKPFLFSVRPTDTINDILERYKIMIGRIVDTIVDHNGKELIRDKSLAENGINEDSKLILRAPQVHLSHELAD